MTLFLILILTNKVALSQYIYYCIVVQHKEDKKISMYLHKHG